MGKPSPSLRSSQLLQVPFNKYRCSQCSHGFYSSISSFFFFYNETVLPNEIHRLIHSCYTAQLAGFLEKPLQLNYEPLIQCLFLHNVFLPTTSPLICVEHNHILTPQKGNENVGVSYRTCCSIELMQCGVSVFQFCPYP